MTSTLPKELTLMNIQAHQLAVDGVERGSDISQTTKEIYGMGASANEDYFGKKFAINCSNVAIHIIKADPDSLPNTSNKLFKSLELLNDTHYALGVFTFKEQLISEIPSFVHEDRKLKTEIIEQITQASTHKLSQSIIKR